MTTKKQVNITLRTRVDSEFGIRYYVESVTNSLDPVPGKHLTAEQVAELMSQRNTVVMVRAQS